mmetsp:Transcript_15987/g.45776  ORF Transcript_15987/g.45776 Transcript_15987/m.45776 type:complete len:203 (-) Transcript_15987:45-653(-)
MQHLRMRDHHLVQISRPHTGPLQQKIHTLLHHILRARQDLRMSRHKLAHLALTQMQTPLEKLHPRLKRLLHPQRHDHRRLEHHLANQLRGNPAYMLQKLNSGTNSLLRAVLKHARRLAHQLDNLRVRHRQRLPKKRNLPGERRGRRIENLHPRTRHLRQLRRRHAQRLQNMHLRPPRRLKTMGHRKLRPRLLCTTILHQHGR